MTDIQDGKKRVPLCCNWRIVSLAFTDATGVGRGVRRSQDDSDEFNRRLIEDSPEIMRKYETTRIIRVSAFFNA